jgi:hypothetical protein
LLLCKQFCRGGVTVEERWFGNRTMTCGTNVQCMHIISYLLVHTWRYSCRGKNRDGFIGNCGLAGILPRSIMLIRASEYSQIYFSQISSKIVNQSILHRAPQGIEDNISESYLKSYTSLSPSCCSWQSDIHCTPEGAMGFFATNRATKHMGRLNASPLITLDMWQP